jgi:hypothetical protein
MSERMQLPERAENSKPGEATSAAVFPTQGQPEPVEDCDVIDEVPLDTNAALAFVIDFNVMSRHS